MQFTQSLPYGQLISQSETAGTVLTSKDDQGIEVVYSAGQPYIKDYRRSELLEGDLQNFSLMNSVQKGEHQLSSPLRQLSRTLRNDRGDEQVQSVSAVRRYDHL